jgi:hypothetical protein
MLDKPARAGDRRTDIEPSAVRTAATAAVSACGVIR